MPYVSKKLLIFTKSYPFGSGEAFLNAEVNALANHFSDIVVQPFVLNGPARSVPSNVTVLPPVWPDRNAKIRFYLGAFGRLKLVPTIIREFVQYLRTVKNGAQPRDGIVFTGLRTLLKITHWSLFRVRSERIGAVSSALLAGGNITAYSYWGHLTALPARYLERAGISVFVRFHRVDLYQDASAAVGPRVSRSSYMPFFHEYARSGAKLLFISEHGARYFREHWLPEGGQERMFLSYLGVPDAGQRPPKPPGHRVLRIVSCSRISAVKRVDVIASLINRLGDFIHVEWHHFGEGDASLIQNSLAKRRSPNVSVNLHGYIDNDRLRAFYRETYVDLFINLSASEGLPVSILEAISADIPVIATSVNGTPEAVVPGTSGILVDDRELDDVAGLAHDIAQLLVRGGLDQLTPRRLWEERFDASKNYEQLCAIIDKG